MRVLVIGADEITPIKAVLKNLGAKDIEHWDARNEKIIKFEATQNVVAFLKFSGFFAKF